MLLYQSLLQFEKKDPQSTALMYMGKRFSYQTLLSSIDDAAARLSRLVKPGEVVTICMPNTPECVYCFYAVNRIGAIAHMVHPLAPQAQLLKFMRAANSKLLITLSINIATLKPIAAEYPIISIHPARSLPGIMRFAFNLKTPPYKGDMTNITPFDNLARGELLPPTTRDSASTGVYLHSGGTGGEPKIIELSDDSIDLLARRGREALGKENVKGMYMLAALPMFHGFGLTMCIHAILIHGGVSVLMPKFDAKAAVKLIKRNRLNFIIGVPALFRGLLRQADFKGEMLKNIYIAFVGGDCAPQDLLDEFNTRMQSVGANGRLFEGYGLTETVTVCAVNNFAHNRKGSMGFPLSGLKAMIIDPETKTPLASGETGEIAISGDTLMNGYLNNPTENENVFIDADGEKYVRTGDCGYVDEDGFLYFKQRLKRIIKIAGISVYPKEIECSAEELSGVTGACAVEYKKNGKTEIALFLTGNPPDDDVIRQKIESDLSRYAVPRMIKTVDSFPVTAVMKINTLELTALADRLANENEN